MSDKTRGLSTQSITAFRGINRFTNITATSPQFATDLLNVVCTTSGQLSKLRALVNMSAAAMLGTCYGAEDYQSAAGLRQIIGCFGTKIYKFEADAITGVYTATEVNDHVDNAHPWSMVESNNILFMANGYRMLKWTGAAIFKWGIQKPAGIMALLDDSGPVVKCGRTTGVAMYEVATSVSMIVGDSVQVASPGGILNVTGPINSIPDGTHFTVLLPGADVALGPIAGQTYVIHGLVNCPSGRKYKVAYKSSVTGHEGSASKPSDSIPAVNGTITMMVNEDVPAVTVADPQIDTLVWYATLNGGVEYLYHSENLISAGTVLRDRKPDAELDPLRRACLINDPPVRGKYLSKWGGRIYIACLDGAAYDLIYSGYEQVRNGRPEESFPPNNRLRLATGADEIRGMGVVQAGIVVGSKSNELFMFRGEVEDIVTGEPMAYSALLEELPFQTAIVSHRSIKATPYGVHWSAPSRTIESYDGTGKPSTLSAAITSVMKSITKGYEELQVACFLNYLEKDWYVIGLPVEGSTVLNRIAVFDLGDDPAESAGIFLFDIGEFDYIFTAEDASGRNRIMVVQGGNLKELKTVVNAENGIPEADGSETAGVLPAYWYSGYAGNEDSATMKMWRRASIVSSSPVKAHIRLVDDVTHKFSNPLVIDSDPTDGDVAINWKSRRCSIGVIFPENDADCAVNEIRYSYIPLSDR